MRLRLSLRRQVDVTNVRGRSRWMGCNASQRGACEASSRGEREGRRGRVPDEGRGSKGLGATHRPFRRRNRFARHPEGKRDQGGRTGLLLRSADLCFRNHKGDPGRPGIPHGRRLPFRGEWVHPVGFDSGRPLSMRPSPARSSASTGSSPIPAPFPSWSKQEIPSEVD